MFEVNYQKKRVLRLNLPTLIFLSALIGSVLVPAFLFGTFFSSAKAETTDNVVVTSNSQNLLDALSSSMGSNSAAATEPGPCSFPVSENGKSCPADTHFTSGCNPSKGQMCFCSGPYTTSNGRIYGSKVTYEAPSACGIDCSLAKNCDSSPNKDVPVCGNPYSCGACATPTPTPTATPAPAARCDYLDGPSGDQNPGTFCYTAHGTYSNGAKADHVDVTFRSSNGETLDNRTTSLNGATNGVVSAKQCFTVNNPGTYNFTATYYSQGGVNVDRNGAADCAKSITVKSVPVVTTTPVKTPTPTPTATPTTVPPTRTPQTVSIAVTTKCTDNPNYNLNDGKTVSVRLYDQGQANNRLEKLIPNTFSNITENSTFVLVPGKTTIPLSNGATAILRNTATVNGNTVNLGTISPINFNNGYHLQLTPSQNTTVEFLYDNCNVIPTQTPTPTPTVTPTTVPPTTPPVVKNALCTSITKTSQTNSTICYKVTGQFNNVNASKVRVYYDQNNPTIYEERDLNKTGTVSEENFCHNYDSTGDFSASAQFYTPVNSGVNVQGNLTGACLISNTISPTPTPTTVPPTSTTTVVPTVLGATITPTPAPVLVNTGQINTVINIILGVAIFLIIIGIRYRNNKNSGEKFEDIYMNYYTNPITNPSLEVTKNDSQNDPFDLYSYEKIISNPSSDLPLIVEEKEIVKEIPENSINKNTKDRNNPGRLI